MNKIICHSARRILTLTVYIIWQSTSSATYLLCIGRTNKQTKIIITTTTKMVLSRHEQVPHPLTTPRTWNVNKSCDCEAYDDGIFSHFRGLRGKVQSQSPPALFCCCLLVCFEVKISSRTLIPLFRLGSVHSGSASWDNCGQEFPDELHVSFFIILL